MLLSNTVFLFFTSFSSSIIDCVSCSCSLSNIDRRSLSLAKSYRFGQRSVTSFTGSERPNSCIRLPVRDLLCIHEGIRSASLIVELENRKMYQLLHLL